MQSQPILTTKWLNFWRRMKTILPKELSDMKTLSVHSFLCSKWNILYRSCYCDLFMCSFLFKISIFIWAERTNNKNSCDPEYFTWKAQNVNEWMKPQKCQRYCFLSQNILVFKMCSIFSLPFITFTALWCVMVWTNVFYEMYRSWRN